MPFFTWGFYWKVAFQRQILGGAMQPPLPVDTTTDKALTWMSKSITWMGNELTWRA